MDKKITFPKLKKTISNFMKEEEGTILRSKAAIVGPVAATTVILMSKDMAISSEASSYQSHSSHRSHSSSIGHSSHSSASLPSHSSHSSGLASGFSHTAGTFQAEARNADNN